MGAIRKGKNTNFLGYLTETVVYASAWSSITPPLRYTTIPTDSPLPMYEKV